MSRTSEIPSDLYEHTLVRTIGQRSQARLNCIKVNANDITVGNCFDYYDEQGNKQFDFEVVNEHVYY